MKSIVLALLMLVVVIGSGCSNSAQTTPAQEPAPAPAPAASTPSEQPAEAAQQAEEPKTDFPTKTIELIIPLGPGGGADLVARTLANSVSKYLPNGQSVVVVNKPGGAATIGMTEVANAKPDGYTIGQTSNTSISVQPHYGNTPYSYDSFRPIIRVILEPLAFVVHKDAPWNTLDEWIAYVEENPGKFTYGAPGAGSTPHVAMEAFSSALGLETKVVAFESGAQMANAILGGHVQGAITKLASFKSQIESGDVKILASTGTQRIEQLKDIPLFMDKAPSVQFDLFTGIVAPKDLPDAELEILHEAFKKTIEDPAVVAELEKLDAIVAYAGPDEFEQIIAEDFQLYKEVLTNIGLIQ